MKDIDVTAYELLGVHRGATKTELDAARRRLALAYHPDRNPTGALVMAAANVAYDTLVDAQAHKRYRAELLATHCVCTACAGEGARKRQRGFKACVLVACAVCKGVGLVERPHD